MRTNISTTLEPLVEQGTLSLAQLHAVEAAFDDQTSQAQQTRRHVLSEILSYIGGAVIIISGAFIVAQAWEPLGAWGRSGLILLGAAVMFAGGWVLSTYRRDDSARRLSGVLFVGAALLVTIAVGSLLQSLLFPDPFEYVPSEAWKQPGLMSIAIALGLVVALIGYARVHTIVGQAGIAAATVGTLLSLGTAITYYTERSDMSFPSTGFWFVLVLGIGWIAISRVGAFAEPVFALVVGVVLVFVGLQATRGLDTVEWASGTLTLAVGFAFLALYVWWREWPMLAGGILGILAGGIELFVRYFEGLGAALASLSLGVALLVVGLIMLRSKRSHEQMLGT